MIHYNTSKHMGMTLHQLSSCRGGAQMSRTS